MRWTRRQLSMILSHIAGGGALCCGHDDERNTVTDDSAHRVCLAIWAQDAMTCGHDHDPHDRDERTRRCLEVAEQCCTHGGPQ
jgi:hypothetical protein